MQNARFLATMLVLALGLGLIGAAQAALPENGGSKSKISATGRVEAGVEAGCLIVRGKDQKTYNVFFGTGSKPQIGQEISFEGKQHDGPTTCMQGTAVDVTNWKPASSRHPRK